MSKLICKDFKDLFPYFKGTIEGVEMYKPREEENCFVPRHFPFTHLKGGVGEIIKGNWVKDSPMR